jgi:hypothetical protein
VSWRERSVGGHDRQAERPYRVTLRFLRIVIDAPSTMTASNPSLIQPYRWILERHTQRDALVRFIGSPKKPVQELRAESPSAELRAHGYAHFRRFSVDEAVPAIIAGPQSHPRSADRGAICGDGDDAVVARSAPAADVPCQLRLLEQRVIRRRASWGNEYRQRQHLAQERFVSRLGGTEGDGRVRPL